MRDLQNKLYRNAKNEEGEQGVFARQPPVPRGTGVREVECYGSKPVAKPDARNVAGSLRTAGAVGRSGYPARVADEKNARVSLTGGTRSRSRSRSAGTSFRRTDRAPPASGNSLYPGPRVFH